MLGFSVSYWDLIKCVCFACTTEMGDRGWKESSKTGLHFEFIYISNIFEIFVLKTTLKNATLT
jgi:hypothetical protein